jgi:hypothetical protein
MTAFSLFRSVVDSRSEYVFLLVWFCVGTLVYFLFFVHFCIHGHLSSDCLWYINDGECGLVGCLLPVNLVFVFFCLILIDGVIVRFLEMSRKCTQFMILISIIIIVKETTCCGCIPFFSFKLSGLVLIYTHTNVHCFIGSGLSNYSHRELTGQGSAAQMFRWQTDECGPSDSYHTLTQRTHY